MLKKCVAAILTTFVVVGYALAAEQCTVSIEGDMVRVQGTLASPKSYQHLTIQVRNQQDEPVYFNQDISTQGGVFDFSFRFAEQSGLYKLMVKSDAFPNAAPMTESFTYYNSGDVEKGYEYMNGITSESALADYIENNAALLGIDNDLYQKIVDADRFDALCKGLWADANKTAGADNFESVDAFKALVLQNCVIQLFNIGNTDISSIFADYGTILEITPTSNQQSKVVNYARYAAMDGEQRAAVHQSLAAVSTEFTKANLHKLISEQIMLNALKTAVSVQVISIIRECEAYITFVPTINSLSGTQIENVCAALAGKTIRDFDDVASKYTTAAQQSSGNRGSGGSGGSGGGGGGGGGGGSISDITAPTEFSQPTQVEPPEIFIDLDQAEWARDDILFLNEKDVVSGYEDRSYRPNNKITREEFVKMLVSLFKFTDETAMADFQDVNSDDWFYPFVSVAQKYGIVHGVDQYTFGVGQFITRQDLCTMVYRMAVRNGVKLEPPKSYDIFSDNTDIREYAQDGVYALKTKGVITGLGNNIFDPNGHATRAQVAKILAGVSRVADEKTEPASTPQAEAEDDEQESEAEQ